MDSKYVQDWMPYKSSLTSFYHGISAYVEKHLSDVDAVDVDNLSAKVIADPLLGYINLTPLEVAIIDTPLYQRLRKIRQLGLAHLVFPSLNYSRFEHSLGVLGRLNQLLNKLLENYGRANPDEDLNAVIRRYTDAVRLAALLHDIGHCLFSHCSERVISQLNGTSNYPSAKEISAAFTSHFEKEKPIPFAEIFSISIVGSRAFHDFINKLNFFKPRDISRNLENCCRFILGMHVKDDPNTVFLAQLISSGLDADKIDYMAREQLYTGIKLEIDLDRILSKLNVFKLNSFELPKNLEHFKKHFDADKQFKVLGFSKGGQFVFEEFCIARLALHVKIYLHQKVRSAESQLSKYLQEISQNETGLGEAELQKAHNWLQLPESILEIPSLIDTAFSERSLFDTNFVKDKERTNLLNINNRVLFERAFAFGQINSYSEANYADRYASKKIEDFFDRFQERELEQLIIQEVIIISGILKITITADDLQNFIIDIPKLRFKSIQQGQESIYFERSSLSPLRWTIPLDKIVIYFEENRALGYVFTETQHTAVFGLAAEKVIFDICGKVFSQEGNVSRSTFSQIIVYKKILTERLYYRTLPELQNISEYLKKADAAEKIKSIHEKLAAFESLKKDRITISRITTFVNQFPVDLQEPCLMFLQQLKVYDERRLEDELRKIIDKCFDTSKLGIAYLGGVSDSGGRISYHLRDLFETYDLEAKEINDGLILKSQELIIYDDNINSGLQLLNIMAELIDEKNHLPAKLSLNEQHLPVLTNKDARQKLKDMPIHFCFIIGYEDTERKIRKLLSENLGFKAENIYLHISKVFKNSEKVFNGSDSRFNHAKKLELKEYMTRIGEELLASEGKDREKIESCRLGYANAEAMVLFPYNIPTMTVTAVWCKGTLQNGVPWIPLAERRRRIKDGKYIGED